MARRGGGSDKLDRQIILVASVVVLGAIMSILDTTIVNVALATLGHELHASLQTIQWVATGYLIALAVVIPLTGWASERFGARRLWMTVVVLFVIGSVLCGLAWNSTSLIFFRVLQGLGGGMIMPAGMTILAQAAGPQRMGRVMSVVGAPMLLGPILGPVLGGLILQSLSWRWIFFVNVPIGALALILALKFLPRSQPQHAEKLDVLGFILLSPGLALIVFGLSELADHGGISYVGSWLPMVLGVCLVAAFVGHALHTSRRPLLDLKLFRSAGFSAAAISVFLGGAALFGAMLILPLYFQVGRGTSTLASGILMIPSGLGAAMIMPISGRVTDRIGGGRVVLFGMVLVTVTTVFMTGWGPDTSFVLTSVNLFIRGIGFGCAMMPAMASAYSTVSRTAVPRATTALNVLQRVGASLGTALLAVVLENQVKANVPGGAAFAGALGPLPASVRERVATPLAAAFSTTFWWATAMTAVAILPAIVLAFKVRTGSRTAPPAGTLVAAASE